MSRRAKFQVTRELMLQVFSLPKGTEILDVRTGEGPLSNVTFVVSHPDLKEAPEGETPDADPQFRAQYDQDSMILPKFVGWGQT